MCSRFGDPFEPRRGAEAFEAPRTVSASSMKLASPIASTVPPPDKDYGCHRFRYGLGLIAIFQIGLDLLEPHSAHGSYPYGRSGVRWRETFFSSEPDGEPDDSSGVGRSRVWKSPPYGRRRFSGDSRGLLSWKKLCRVVKVAFSTLLASKDVLSGPQYSVVLASYPTWIGQFPKLGTIAFQVR